MKIIETKTKVYKFEELTEEAKDKAISDHIEFLIETLLEGEASDNFKKACKKAEEMRTPWFTGSYVYDYCKEEIIEEIKINDYDFTEEGKLF